MKHHYHVLTGLAGLYMPNDNAVFSNRRDALAYMTEEKNRFADDDFCAGYDGTDEEPRPPWTGSQREECYTNGTESIELHECDEPDCEVEE